MRRLLILSVLALVLVAGSFSYAIAQTPAADCDSTLVFDQSWVLGVIDMNSYPSVPYGTDISVVGMVTGLGGPLADAARPGYEYTWEIPTVTCAATSNWDDFDNDRGGVISYFNDLQLNVYEDETPDANINHPGTYADGVLVLTLHFDDFELRNFSAQYDFEDIFGACEATGGAWFDRLSVNSTGPSGNFRGWYPASGNLEPPFGAIARIAGRIQFDCSVPVRATTWGRLKALYR